MILNLPLYLSQAHLTELSEEQAKYMGLSKTGKLERQFFPGICKPLSYLQAPSNQTTIATSEEMVVLARCSPNGRTANLGHLAFALYSVQWKSEHPVVQSFHANKCEYFESLVLCMISDL